MNFTKIILSIIIALLTYALVDILLWGRIFEGSQDLLKYSQVYYYGYHLILISNIVIGSILIINSETIRKTLFYASTLYVFGTNGTEDILYFLLDGRSIPNRLEWLDNSALILLKPVTNFSLVLNLIIWIIAWSVLWLSIWKKIPSYTMTKVNNNTYQIYKNTDKKENFK